MQPYADYDQVWLVKSAGMVLGPFSLVELIQALKEHRVALLDEVRSPTARWGFVREHKQLAEIIRAIRTEQTGTEEITGITQPMSLSDEKTPVPGIEKTSKNLSNLKQQELSKKSSNSTIVPKPLGNAKVFQPNTKSASLLKKIIYIAITSAVVTIGISFYKKEMASSAAQAVSEILARAQYYKSIGLYDKALGFYQKAIATQKSNVQIKYEVIPLLLQLDTDSSTVLNYINEVKSAKNLPVGAKQNLMTWQSLVLMQQQLYGQADEQLKLAITQDPSNIKNLINQVVNYFLMGQFKEVLQNANILAARGIKNQVLTLTSALAVIELSDDNLNKNQIAGIVSELFVQVKGSSDFKVESYLLRAALQFKLGQSTEAEQSLRKVFNYEPLDRQFYVHELDVSHQAISWKFLTKICKNVLSQSSNTSLRAAISVYCLAASEDIRGASIEMESMVKKFPYDENVLELYAAILMKQGQFQDAKSFSQSSKGRLGMLVQAQICFEEKDLICAESNLKAILKSDPTDPAALYHLSRLDLMQNKKVQARLDIEKGLLATKNYRPLIEMEDILSAY